jgi:FkbM family methyltransferase
MMARRFRTHGRFLAVKKAVAKVLVTETVGHVLGRLFRERIPSRGATIDTSRPVVTGIVKAMLFLRMYESAELRFVARYLRTDLDVVELGSSLGVVTSQIARRLEPGRRVVAVEANEDLLSTLRANVALNAPGVEIRTVTAAIDYGGAAEVELALGDHSFVARVGADPSAARSRRVRATTLAQVTRDHAIGDFALVCDIEGAELDVFTHERDTLARCRQIVCELHATHRDGGAYSPDDLRDLLVNRHGFRLQDRVGNVCVFVR